MKYVRPLPGRSRSPLLACDQHDMAGRPAVVSRGSGVATAPRYCPRLSFRAARRRLPHGAALSSSTVASLRRGLFRCLVTIDPSDIGPGAYLSPAPVQGSDGMPLWEAKRMRPHPEPCHAKGNRPNGDSLAVKQHPLMAARWSGAIDSCRVGSTRGASRLQRLRYGRDRAERRPTYWPAHAPVRSPSLSGKRDAVFSQTAVSTANLPPEAGHQAGLWGSFRPRVNSQGINHAT